MKLGTSGNKVKHLQRKLNKILRIQVKVDGIFGIGTMNAVKKLQKQYGLTIDGIVGAQTNREINKQYNILMDSSDMVTFQKPRFVVFVDAGHGGINDLGRYVTAGKQAYHEGTDLHQNGHYYEGYENRIVSEMFIEQMTKEGIQTIRIYHPVDDTPLSERTRLVNSYLKRGYFGYLMSFHSNAISSSNSKQKLESTRGFCVFSTRGNTLSDKIAEKHFSTVFANVKDWKLRTQTRQDGDSDFEANFQILRQTDKNLKNFGAILEEWGFHTSKIDTEFIIDSRNLRVSCAVKTAKKVKKMMKG